MAGLDDDDTSAGELSASSAVELGAALVRGLRAGITVPEAVDLIADAAGIERSRFMELVLWRLESGGEE